MLRDYPIRRAHKALRTGEWAGNISGCATLITSRIRLAGAVMSRYVENMKNFQETISWEHGRAQPISLQCVHLILMSVSQFSSSLWNDCRRLVPLVLPTPFGTCATPR